MSGFIVYALVFGWLAVAIWATLPVLQRRFADRGDVESEEFVGESTYAPQRSNEHYEVSPRSDDDQYADGEWAIRRGRRNRLFTLFAMAFFGLALNALISATILLAIGVLGLVGSLLYIGYGLMQVMAMYDEQRLSELQAEASTMHAPPRVHATFPRSTVAVVDAVPDNIVPFPTATPVRDLWAEGPFAERQRRASNS